MIIIISRVGCVHRMQWIACGDTFTIHSNQQYKRSQATQTSSINSESGACGSIEPLAGKRVCKRYIYMCIYALTCLQNLQQAQQPINSLAYGNRWNTVYELNASRNSAFSINIWWLYFGTIVSRFVRMTDRNTPNDTLASRSLVNSMKFNRTAHYLFASSRTHI